jgi:beta-N-acetylhexosaminidase
MELRPYDALSDGAEVYELWDTTMGASWTLLETEFHRVVADGEHYVCLKNGAVAGFVATAVSRTSEGKGSVQLLLVAKEHRRRGIGQSLLRVATDSLRGHGVRTVQLGSGGDNYFWPGVPVDLPEAIAFFQAHGWKYYERSFDLAMKLDSYSSPPAIFDRMALINVQLRQSTSSEAADVVEFEAIHHPGWLTYFERAIRYGAFQDILIARNQTGTIIGTVLVSDKNSEWEENGILWQRQLGNDAGAIGCLGVREDARSQGIGLALSARATEILKARGVRTSYLGWTWLVDWYGQLGYRIWKEYEMSSMILQ